MISTIRQRTLIATVLMTVGISEIPAQQSSQRTFSTADEASQKLFDAVQNNDEQSLVAILGEQPGIASSGDEAQDKTDRELFVKKYQEMHRLHRESDGSLTLYVGAENWPFPLRLISSNGNWRFDTDAGAEEILFRRIGENEEIAIAVCREFVAARNEYLAGSVVDRETESFPMTLAANAASGSTDAALFHGYYFRALGPRGSLIAWPAEYRSSGVMTFIVVPENSIYEKDLGSSTTASANGMKAFLKDATWHGVTD